MTPSPPSSQYVSAKSWARIVKVLLISGAIVSGLSIVAAGLSFLFPPFADDQEVADNLGGFVVGLIELGLGLLTLLIFIATVVFFLIWLHRSHKNLRAFGASARNLHHSPGWAVGSFFVPIANLVIPYRAVKEVWQNSVPANETMVGLGGAPSWFPLWWFFWLTSNFAGNIYFRLSFNEQVPEHIVTVIGVVSDSLSMIAAIFAIVIVGEITKRQEETARMLMLGQYALPPSPPTVGSPAGQTFGDPTPHSTV